MEDGCTLRQHLERAAIAFEQAGVDRRDPRLDVEAPRELALVVEAFARLNKRRQNGMMGPNPIPYSEVVAMMEARRIRLTPYEVDVLTEMDDVFMRHMLGGMTDQNKQG